ncbi:inosine/xanthosine triphosphatase [Algoriphagus persicinus]|uniref:inosine/xanthosine triphosphatase n=1 Tax=Algoriphagus persicinus TaxID=3108754 RepID=UPI002B3999AC|nr:MULTISPECIES: inosine/xanthosine triphosphatase [unclassified Algoriphagus]MEB2778964.1 inosine/xanthosine triphosphatase [Algoriphagus sp. C2-6-M1]MEB2783478.1 inosine/xanthosine triphosphatase [Algoriphagus sp. E1-3-M2]
MNFPKRENFQATEKPLVIVGSKNPVKIACTDSAFTEAFSSGFVVNGITAASQVSDQPKGEEETYLGARNRVINAKTSFPEADYWVGIEGGIGEDVRGMYAFAWIYIENRSGLHGISKTGSFYLPEAIAKLIHSGMELGAANDTFFAQENSKQNGGAVGILTRGAVSRQTYYNQAIVLALIPFLNKALF